MNNLMLLMKVQVQSMLSRTNGRKNRKKAAAGLGSLLLLGGVFIYISVIYTVGMVMMFPEESRYITLYVMGMVTIFMLLVFGYQSAGGHLFGFKDFDLLMSLPVKKSTVLMSKFLSFLFLEYFYAFFLLIPSLIIVGVYSHYGILYYILGIFAWLLIPIVPMVIASMLAFLAQYIAGRFKYKNLMNNISYIILMGAVFGLIFSYQNVLMFDSTKLFSLKEGIETYMPFIGWLFDGMVNLHFGHYLLGVGLNILVLVLFIWLFSNHYMKLNGQIRSGYKVKNFKLRESRSKSPFKALFHKEIRTYFSNTIYFMNTAIMPVLLMGGCAYLCLGLNNQMKMVAEYMPGIVMPLLCGSIMLLTFTSCTTNCSISLEGKNFETLKAFPVSVSDIFWAKIALNLVVVLPCSLICSLMVFFALDLSLVDLLLCVVTSLTSAYFIAALGLILNLHYNRLDWDNPAVIVKQSMPVFITTIGGIVMSMVIIFLGVELAETFSPMMIVGGLNLLLLLVDLGMYYYLKHGGKDQFNRIY